MGLPEAFYKLLVAADGSSDPAVQRAADVAWLMAQGWNAEESRRCSRQVFVRKVVTKCILPKNHEANTGEPCQFIVVMTKDKRESIRITGVPWREDE